MRVSIFTSSDETFFPLLQDMISSLGTDLTVFDDGLSPASRSKLPSNVTVIKPPDIRSLYPAYDYSTTRAAMSLAVRPFLNDYAPEADVIVWVDADIWFQDKKGLEDLIWATEFGVIAAVPEVGRLVSYVGAFDAKTSFEADMLNYYGQNAVKLAKYPLLQLGIFAAKTDSPIWSMWREDLNKALISSRGAFHFGIEQAALNYTVLSRGLTFSPLPYTHNYSARLITSLIDGDLCVNAVPFEKIHVVHLIGDAKWKTKTVIRRDRQGQVLEVLDTAMTYRTIQELL